MLCFMGFGEPRINRYQHIPRYFINPKSPKMTRDELFAVFFLILGLVVYFYPSVIAYTKKKRNKGAIIALNILLGWTVIGWVGALIWALSYERPIEE